MCTIHDDQLQHMTKIEFTLYVVTHFESVVQNQFSLV